MNRPGASWRWAALGIGAAALALRWPVPEPGWTHFDEIAFVVLPLGFWSGDLNPHYFNYPTFHFYLSSALYFLAYLASAAATVRQFVAWHYLVDGHALVVLARGLDSVLSAATVVATGLLGRRLYGDRAGLLAAGFLAVLPLAVRFAHLAATDTPAVFWIAMAVLWAVRSRQEGRGGALLAAGVCTGLAAATKYPAALVAVPVAVALTASRPGAAWGRAGIAAAAAVLAFAVATPYVWLDPVTFRAHVTDMVQTHLRSDPQRSGAGLVAALRYGIGAAGSVAAAAALAHGAWRRAWPDLSVASGALVFAGFTAAAGSTFMRYALPLAPFAALLMARAVAAAGGRRVVAAAAVIALGAEPLYASLGTRRLLAGPDTRQQAEAWVAARAPRGGRLDEADSPCGRIHALRPGDVLLRQAHFLRSFGAASLREAYQSLAGRSDLPPLYLDLGGADAPGPALALRYRHPVCPPAADAPGGAGQQTFSPGRVEAAIFDPQDWLFVPVAGFGQVDATGPVIDVAPVAALAREPATTADFFATLSWILEAHAADGAGDGAAAARLYERVLQAWPVPQDWVGDEVAGRLHVQIARNHARAGRTGPAVDQLERAIALLPRDPGPRHELGRVWAAAGRLDRAIGEWTALVEQHPDFAPALRDLALARHRQADPGRARDFERRARGLPPDLEYRR